LQFVGSSSTPNGLFNECLLFSWRILSFVTQKRASAEGFQTMLDAILFVILGLVVFWVLTAIFEALGLKDRPYTARLLAAVLTIVAAYVGTGYQHWWQVLIGVGAAFVYLQILKESHHKSVEKS